MSTYPSNIPVFPTLTDEVDVVAANDENSARNEIIALCQYVGTSPQGSKSDLTTRLAQLIATNGAFAQGSAFPTNPVEGQGFWRPDLITFYIYGNGNWNSLGQSLSNHVFSYYGVPYGAGATFNTASAYTTFAYTKFKKISGISNVNFYYYIKNPGGNTVLSNIAIGSIVVTFPALVIATATSGFVTMDVSGLTNGTAYDLVLQYNNNGANARFEYIEGIGS